jgi:hypothetical protein
VKLIVFENLDFKRCSKNIFNGKELFSSFRFLGVEQRPPSVRRAKLPMLNGSGRNFLFFTKKKGHLEHVAHAFNSDGVSRHEIFPPPERGTLREQPLESLRTSAPLVWGSIGSS